VNIQSSPDYLFAPCHGCQQPIFQNDESSFLVEVGAFHRLRCGDPACGLVDWYHQNEFNSGTVAASISQPAPLMGQVFVHDILLELTSLEPSATETR
jgi:hypothetical protein